MHGICIYDYYGLEICLSATAELPIHIYAFRGEASACIVLKFQNGYLQSPELSNDNCSLDPEDLENFRILAEQNGSEIIKCWMDHFVYDKAVSAERIREKLIKRNS